MIIIEKQSIIIKIPYLLKQIIIEKKMQINYE